MTIALDADGVIFDYVGAAAEWANQQLEVRNSPGGFDNGGFWCSASNAHDWDILKAWGFKELQDRLDRWCSQPGFVSGLKLYSGAAAFVTELIQTHDVVVATSCPTSWHAEREQALMELGFRKKDIAFIARKELLQGCSVLIDDCAANFDGFSGFRCLVDRPWNQYATNCARFTDYDSILHALRFVE